MIDYIFSGTPSGGTTGIALALDVVNSVLYCSLPHLPGWSPLSGSSVAVASASLLHVGPQTGFGTTIAVNFIPSSLSLLTALNPIGGSAAQINTYTFATEDNSAIGTHANSVSLYAVMVSTHTTGTKQSTVGIEGDAFVDGAGGTTLAAVGVIGFAAANAGTTTELRGLYGEVDVRGGVVSNAYGAVLICPVQTGGTLTSGGGLHILGPSITGGVTTNALRGILIDTMRTGDIPFEIDTDSASNVEMIRLDNANNGGSALTFTQSGGLLGYLKVTLGSNWKVSLGANQGDVLTAFQKNAFISVPASAPTDSDLANSNITFYLDEVGNNLKARIKYSTGTLKTATVAVV